MTGGACRPSTGARQDGWLANQHPPGDRKAGPRWRSTQAKSSWPKPGRGIYAQLGRWPTERPGGLRRDQQRGDERGEACSLRQSGSVDEPAMDPMGCCIMPWRCHRACGTLHHPTAFARRLAGSPGHPAPCSARELRESSPAGAGAGVPRKEIRGS